MNIVFENRHSSTPHRRKITFQGQDPVYADIELADNPDNAGTAITADILNQMNSEINENTTKSNSALQLANEAKAIAEEARNNSTADVGTVVQVGGVDQTTWNSDLKLDKSQGTVNSNKTMVVGSNGNITPSDYIYIGNIKVYQTSEGIAFEFPN